MTLNNKNTQNILPLPLDLGFIYEETETKTYDVLIEEIDSGIEKPYDNAVYRRYLKHEKNNIFEAEKDYILAYFITSMGKFRPAQNMRLDSDSLTFTLIRMDV